MHVYFKLVKTNELNQKLEELNSNLSDQSEHHRAEQKRLCELGIDNKAKNKLIQKLEEKRDGLKKSHNEIAINFKKNKESLLLLVILKPNLYTVIHKSYLF